MGSIEQYGRFIEKEACFELTEEPPRKWLNIHYNKIGEHEVYAEISNIGDGPITMRDGKGVTCRLVGYDAKYVYIRDEESGMVFSPWGAPAPQEVIKRSCKYYPAKTVITSQCQNLRVTHRIFVPRDYLMEVQTITVQNLSKRPRKISIFAYAMFQLTGNDAEGNGVWKDNFSEVLPEINGVFVTNRNGFVPTDRFKGFISTLQDFRAGTGYRDHFLRSEFAVGTPKILFGWDCDNKPGYGPDCAGVVQVTLDIEAKGTARADFMIGQAANVGEVKGILADLSREKIDAMCAEQEGIESERAASFLVRTGFPNYDALMNHFVKKQLYSYLINKSGFRDNLQVDYAMAMIDPRLAEDNLLRALASQYDNGCVPHSFRPLNRLQYSDKPAWILMAVPALIKETGNFTFLQHEVPYLDSEERGTVWDHCLRAMRFLATDLGTNGLCDQHHADWNDGLEATPESGERESVMVTQQLCYGLLEMEDLAKRTGDEAVQREARQLFEQFEDRLNDVAWDGEWYIRTICGDGYRIGSKENREGKIFMNTQSWAIMSQTAEGDRAQQCMSAVDRFCREDLGFRICSPAFTQYDPRVGKMSNGIPDHIENGGCYNHAAGFKAVADCMMGRAEEAWETFVKVAPDNPENPVSVSETEPFSFTNSYSKFKLIYGRSGYPWRTGTAAWFTIVLVEWILGARRSYEGLLIDPCLPKAIPRAEIVRRFRGVTYNIHIDNSSGRGKGPVSITMDGEKIQGNVLPVMAEDTEHEVKVVL